MIFQDLSVWEIAAIVGAFVASGLVRGFNGGAGANFITAPVVALMLGAREGVPVIILVNLVSNIQVLPGALPHADWRRMLPVGLAAMVMTPLGAWILLAVDEDLMRRIVAGTSILLSLLLLSGWRYRGPRGLPIRIGVGSMGGLITGSVSMGGPPVFLYLLSGPRDGSPATGGFSGFRAACAGRGDPVLRGIRPDVASNAVDQCRVVRAVYACLLGRDASVRPRIRGTVPQPDARRDRRALADYSRSVDARVRHLA